MRCEGAEKGRVVVPFTRKGCRSLGQRKIKNWILSPGQCGLVGWNVIWHTKRFGVRFPVRALTWIVGLIPCRGHKGKLIDVSLSHQ